MSRREPLAGLAEEVIGHLRATRQALRKPVETEIARGGLTGPQRSVVHALVHSGGMSLKQLSGRVGLAHSTVSGIVDRLEARGLVERHGDAADGRVTRIDASARVRTYVRDTLPALARSPLTDALRRASSGDRLAILDGLRRLRRLLEEG
jgi:DNA-binding MarR family transcriptional regulator